MEFVNIQTGERYNKLHLKKCGNMTTMRIFVVFISILNLSLFYTSQRGNRTHDLWMLKVKILRLCTCDVCVCVCVCLPAWEEEDARPALARYFSFLVWINRLTRIETIQPMKPFEVRLRMSAGYEKCSPRITALLWTGTFYKLFLSNLE